MSLVGLTRPSFATERARSLDVDAAYSSDGEEEEDDLEAWMDTIM